MESVGSRRTPSCGADLSSATPWTRRISAPRPCSCPSCGARSTAPWAPSWSWRASLDVFGN
eukprot:5151094-Pyramimonas_sp.AAC.1